MHITGIKRKPATGHPVGGLRRFLYDKILLYIIASQVGSRKDKTAALGLTSGRMLFWGSDDIKKRKKEKTARGQNAAWESFSKMAGVNV